MAWAEAARQLGGTFDEKTHKIVARLDPGIEVVAEIGIIQRTSVFAEAAFAGELAIELDTHHSRASMQRALGLPELGFGDSEFGVTFLVGTNRPAQARAWLPAATRQALVAASPRYRFLLAQGRASAERPGIETEFPALVDAMVALAALAGGGRRVRDAWTAFAEEVGGRLSPDSFVHGDLRFEGEVEGRPLLFEVGADGIAVRRELGVRDAPCFEVAPRQPLVSQAGAALLALRPQAESEWQDLQPARLRYDGRQIAVSWDGYLPERDRLLRAARLLAAVETGPYR